MFDFLPTNLPELNRRNHCNFSISFDPPISCFSNNVRKGGMLNERNLCIGNLNRVKFDVPQDDLKTIKRKVSLEEEPSQSLSLKRNL